MKHTLIIFALLTATIQTFAQSPRIKLNQITKDSLSGSVLISSPTDSGMVYSRDLFISYGADTVLILNGDTLAATSAIISSVLSDGVTIVGDGTTGSELTADTSVLATLTALSDSLALISSSVTADGVTITGDGTAGSPLKVDTTTYIATKQDLDLKQDQLNGTGFVKATGTTISYDNSTYLTTEVDGDVSNELQTLSYNSSTNEITLSDGGGTEDLSNLDLIDSTRINATGDTAYYYQNGTLIGTGAIAGGGGGTTYNNITETADTLYVKKYLEVDTSTLYVDASTNRVGIGTSSPSAKLNVEGGDVNFNNNTLFVDEDAGYVGIGTDNPVGVLQISQPSFPLIAIQSTSSITSGSRGDFVWYNSNVSSVATIRAEAVTDNVGTNLDFYIRPVGGSLTREMRLTSSGYLGIGTSSPSVELDVDGNARFRSIGSGASAGALHYTSTGVLTTNTSDVRLKTNLQPLENTLQKLLDINTYTFNWINETDRVDLGMVAQEVEEIFPRLVFTNPVDGYKGIHYDKFSSILTKAIQEQQTIIETQSTEIEQLKTLITELNNKLTILENN